MRKPFFQPVNKSSRLSIFLMLCVMAIAEVAQAQGVVAAKTNSILSAFLSVLMSAGLALFTSAIILAAYKFSFVEGTKLTDLKGLLIGGTLFGIAGAIAAFFVMGV